MHQQQLQYQQQLAAVQAQQAHLAQPNAQGPVSEDFKSQQQQQELFLKANLDYENRLRNHMYQFDEQPHMQGNDLPTGATLQYSQI